MALASMGKVGVTRIYESINDIPEEAQDSSLENFWRNDKYFMYRAKKPKMPQVFLDTPGPWEKPQRKIVPGSWERRVNNG